MSMQADIVPKDSTNQIQLAADARDCVALDVLVCNANIIQLFIAKSGSVRSHDPERV